MKSEAEVIKILKSEVDDLPKLMVMLGTGWNAVLDEAIIETEIGYKDLFGVEASVPGHEGKLVIAKYGDKRVAFMQGRLHMYEGYSAEEATLPMRVFAKMGMKKMVVTAACGALNEKYKVGDFVLESDLITLFLALDNPLKGPKFLDMSQVFDVEMRNIARKIIEEQELSFHEGVYAYYHGPNFETPADKRAYLTLGADVVGMSTVPETIMARWERVKVLGLAFVTNLAFVKHDHEEVMAEANKSREKMKKLLGRLIEEL
jgi:purine-nucleoside phosphorylase